MQLPSTTILFVGLAIGLAACAVPTAATPRSAMAPDNRSAMAPDNRSAMAPDNTAESPGIRLPALREQESKAEQEDRERKEANNPLANMVAFNLQDYAVTDLTGNNDLDANTFWFRYVQPIGGWLMRASLPISRVPTGLATSESGLGDGNVFTAYLFDSDPGTAVGVGPLLGIPTATDDATGTDQWSAGAAAVYFDGTSRQVQWGGLVTYQHKIGGSSRLDDVNFFSFQPFAILKLGEGTYLRSAGTWGWNAASGDFSVPIGIGIGKVVKVGSTVVNVFAEPQFSVIDSGPGQPEFQIYFGMNLQFLGK
jgi:hypothetical protein